MSKTACVLMTALLPTVGHKALVDFALQMVGYHGNVYLFISSRSFEPIKGSDRRDAFELEFWDAVNCGALNVIHHDDDNAPQNPKNLREWMYWYRTVSHPYTFEEPVKYDYVISSEPYGREMADLLDCEFIPFDIDRNLTPVKGSKVRSNITEYANLIMPEFRKTIQEKITFFGQESTGKTTMMKLCTDPKTDIFPYCMGTHEFARPYLENMDDQTVTHEKMVTIANGQYALQKFAYAHNEGFYTFQDTDLLSTIGYNRIYKGKPIPKIEKMFLETISDLYFVMNGDIPFEPDPLRYGITERESSKEFWIDLLNEYGCKYHVVESTSRTLQLDEIYTVLRNNFKLKYSDISNFERE